MIILLQSLLGGAVMAWHQLGGLPPLVAIPLAAWGVAFLGLWRRPRQRRDQRPPYRNPGPLELQPHPLPPARTPGPPPPPPIIRGTPPRDQPCPDHLAELELAERVSRERG